MSKCDECGANPANVHVTQIVSGKTTLMHLCEECARKKGINISIATENAPAAQAPAASAEDGKVCPGCGLKFGEFRASGVLGCSSCYVAFEKEIDRLLVQVHGSSVHRGKRPTKAARGDDSPPDISRLRVQLDKAIRDEEFELAAALRDVIKGLKSGDRTLQSQQG